MPKVLTSKELSCCHLTIDDEAGAIRDVLVVNAASGDAWTLVNVDDGTFRPAWRLELDPGDELGVEALAVAAVAHHAGRRGKKTAAAKQRR